AVTGEFRVNLRAAGFGVFQFFQHDHARAFTHDETIAFLVERARGFLGGVVAGAHGAHGAETADADGDNGRFRAAGEHDVRIAHLDRAPSLSDGVIGGRAGGAGGKTWSAQIDI